MKYLSVMLLAGVCLAVFVSSGFSQDRPLSDLLQKAEQAGLERTALTKLQERAKAGGLSDRQIADMLSPAVDLAEQDLPAEIVFQKALEGMSKGISSDRITLVLENIRRTTIDASVNIVEPWVRSPQVRELINRKGGNIGEEDFKKEMTKSTARALRQDIPSELINEILADVDNESVLSGTSPPAVLAAIGILPDLPEAAKSPRMMRSLVLNALKNGFTAKDLQKLPSAINMAQARSQLPASAVIEGVGDQLQGGVPAKQILQNLFNGNIGGGPPGDIPKGLKNKPDRGEGKGNSGTGGF